ncbi:MAG: hypothetical protein WCD66_05835 [Rhodanobacteraceae bacterium]
MEHQFNLGSAIQPPPFIPRKDPAAPMYASVEGVAVPLSDEEVVFQTRGQDEAQVLTTQVLMSMDHCRPFRSMDEHVAEVIRKVPGLGNHDRVRQGLEMLARTGLMISDADFLEDARGHALTPAPLAGLCIRACDRPDSVRRLLNSLAENEQRHAAGHRVILLDDSRDDGAARQNAELLREFEAQTGCGTVYVGRREQEQVKKQLLKALPEHGQAIDSLLDRPASGFGGGRNWNMALLLTAGRRMFLLDEDFALPLKMHPDVQAGMSLDPNSRAGAWFHDNQADALDAGQRVDGEPFQMHLQYAGQALGHAASSGDWAVDREDLRGLTMADLRGLHDGYRVLTTFNGTRGSTGMASAQALFLLDPDSRARLCASRDAYLRNLEGDNLWHGGDRARAASQGFMTPFAVDNSVLLPCTRVAGRNEDALFNTLARFCHPHTQAMFLPYSIGHVQEPGRARGKARIGQKAWQVNVNSFAYETLLNHTDRCISDDPAQRMRFAADVFDDIASASEHGRIVHLREYLNYARGDMIAKLQQELVSATDAPVFWQADVRALIEANAKAMADNSAPRLSDWPEHVDAHGCAEGLQQSMAEIALGLRAWPAMWQWAEQQGDRLLDSL